MVLATYLAIGLGGVLAYLLFKLLNFNRHWENHGIPGPKPLPFFGNMLPVVLGRQSTGEVLKQLYDEYPNERVVGYYHFIQPRLLIRDQSLIERVLVKDHHSFSSRLGKSDVVNDPLNANLFNMHGNLWRGFRSIMTPIFTPEKLRNMYGLIDSVGDDFVKMLEKSKQPIDLEGSSSSFTVQVIASTALGVDAGPMDDKDNEFRERAFNFAPTGIVTFLKFGAIFLTPTLAHKIGINFTSKETANYFADAFKTVLAHRKSAEATRNDMVQQMMVIQQKKSIEIETDESHNGNSDRSTIPLTDDVLAGQAVFLLFAGFVTSPLSLTYMIYDLAANPEVQERAREEVKTATKSLDGKVTYESLKEMGYLEGCMKESLRISPTHPMIARRCTKDYNIPDVPYTITEGENIMVSALGVHHDANYYEDPSKFLPDRWTGDDRPPSSCYLAWGIGPKMCIGMRFGTVELKSLLAKLLLNFKFSLHPSVKQPVKPHPLGIFTSPAHKILINFEKI